MSGAILRRRDRTARSLRVVHYSSAVNTLGVGWRVQVDVGSNVCREASHVKLSHFAGGVIIWTTCYILSE